MKSANVDEDSLDLAKQLIKRKSAPFAPDKFIDGYEVAVRELVDAKLKHAPIPQDEAPAPVRGKVVNLMDALRKSVGSVKASSEPEADEEQPAPSRSAAAGKSACTTQISVSAQG